MSESEADASVVASADDDDGKCARCCGRLWCLWTILVLAGSCALVAIGVVVSFDTRLDTPSGIFPVAGGLLGILIGLGMASYSLPGIPRPRNRHMRRLHRQIHPYYQPPPTNPN